MIPRFSDYAANERTYLAWIRTAIAIMALAFLIEKFDFFLRYFGEEIGDTSKYHSSPFATLVGLCLPFVAVAMGIGATVRFALNRNAIRSEKTHSDTSFVPNLLLGLLITLVAIFMVIYVGHEAAKLPNLGISK